MKFLVLGGTGHVGSNVVRELTKRQHQVRVLTRDPRKASALGSGVEAFKGDLTDPNTVRTMYAPGVDGVFVVNTVSLTEAAEGLMAVCGAIEAGVKRIVYLSVQHADRAGHLPHFGSKVGVEAGVKVSGAAWTILRPSNFHQNDNLFRDAMLQHGVYPQPLGSAGVSRVDVRDIAELAAIALTQDGHSGKTYDLIGPRPITGPETAEIWSKALGKKIAYAGDDLDAWEKTFQPYMPPALLFDFKLMYRHFQQKGLRGTDEQVAELTKALGHAPRSFEAYAKETAEQWTKEGATTAQR